MRPSVVLAAIGVCAGSRFSREDDIDAATNTLEQLGINQAGAGDSVVSDAEMAVVEAVAAIFLAPPKAVKKINSDMRRTDSAMAVQSALLETLDEKVQQTAAVIKSFYDEMHRAFQSQRLASVNVASQAQIATGAKAAIKRMSGLHTAIIESRSEITRRLGQAAVTEAEALRREEELLSKRLNASCDALRTSLPECVDLALLLYATIESYIASSGLGALPATPSEEEFLLNVVKAYDHTLLPAFTALVKAPTGNGVLMAAGTLALAIKHYEAVIGVSKHQTAMQLFLMYSHHRMSMRQRITTELVDRFEAVAPKELVKTVEKLSFITMGLIERGLADHRDGQGSKKGSHSKRPLGQQDVKSASPTPETRSWDADAKLAVLERIAALDNSSQKSLERYRVDYDALSHAMAAKVASHRQAERMIATARAGSHSFGVSLTHSVSDFASEWRAIAESPSVRDSCTLPNSATLQETLAALRDFNDLNSAKRKIATLLSDARLTLSRASTTLSQQKSRHAEISEEVATLSSDIAALETRLSSTLAQPKGTIKAKDLGRCDRDIANHRAKVAQLETVLKGHIAHLHSIDSTVLAVEAAKSRVQLLEDVCALLS